MTLHYVITRDGQIINTAHVQQSMNQAWRAFVEHMQKFFDQMRTLFRPLIDGMIEAVRQFAAAFHMPPRPLSPRESHRRRRIVGMLNRIH